MKSLLPLTPEGKQILNELNACGLDESYISDRHYGESQQIRLTLKEKGTRRPVAFFCRYTSTVKKFEGRQWLTNKVILNTVWGPTADEDPRKKTVAGRWTAYMEKHVHLPTKEDQT